MIAIDNVLGANIMQLDGALNFNKVESFVDILEALDTEFRGCGIFAQ